MYFLIIQTVHNYILFHLDEVNRVKLSFIRATEGSDYINASFVDVSSTILHMYITPLYIIQYSIIILN